MTKIRSLAASGVVLFATVVLGLAAHAAPSVDGGGEERVERPSAKPASKAITHAVRRALSGVVIADQNRDGVVGAREAARYYQARFGVMDLDDDQVLSWSEFVESRLPVVRAVASGPPAWKRSGRFESLDLDGDGVLDREEFALALLLARRSKDATPRHQRRSEAFDMFDLDGDGALSVREFVAAGERHFAHSDADDDGRVTIWEFLSRLRF